MSGYKSFAVAGVGRLGNFIIDELLKAKSVGKVEQVIGLTRSAAGSNALTGKGAKPIVVDYASPSSLHSALEGIDVLISTLGREGLSAQGRLADAANAAGVKLFIPSDFGGDTRKFTEGAFGMKNKERERLGEIGLRWATFFTGPFSDLIFWQPPAGFDVKNGRAEVGGTGNVPASFTSRVDVARYVVHVTVNLPPTKLHNHIFKVEGQRISINRVLAEYQERTGEKLEITHIPLEEVKERAKTGDFKSILQLMYETDGTYGTEAEMNEDWPEFKPQSVVDAMMAA